MDALNSAVPVEPGSADGSLRPTAIVLPGDCRALMAAMDADSVDAIVCDPPYGLEFMGKDWDAPWKQTSGGFSAPGIGDRETPWPSFTGSNRSRCSVCKKLVGQGGSPRPPPRASQDQAFSVSLRCFRNLVR